MREKNEKRSDISLRAEKKPSITRAFFMSIMIHFSAAAGQINALCVFVDTHHSGIKAADDLVADGAHIVAHVIGGVLIV